MSLGLLEVSGLALAINTADAMAKSAAVTLVGIDTAKGGGWMTIKITGDVAAVNAALSTGAALAEKHGGLIAKALLAHPDDQLFKQVVPTVTITPAPAASAPEIPEADKAPETETTRDAAEDAEPAVQAAIPQRHVTCNLCQDPLCPRQKGEPRSKCIHARGHA